MSTKGLFRPLFQFYKVRLEQRIRQKRGGRGNDFNSIK